MQDQLEGMYPRTSCIMWLLEVNEERARESFSHGDCEELPTLYARLSERFAPAGCCGFRPPAARNEKCQQLLLLPACTIYRLPGGSR
jgi:hypothetical protein